MNGTEVKLIFDSSLKNCSSKFNSPFSFWRGQLIITYLRVSSILAPLATATHQHVNRMVKRRRDEDDDGGQEASKFRRSSQIKPHKLDEVLENSKKSVFRALKVGRGFERQKLGRRQKTAKASKNAAAETVRLEAEVAVLKV